MPYVTQNIGCSLTAYNVIMEDYERFNPNGKPLKKNQFLNNLLIQCHDDIYIQSVVDRFLETRERSMEKTKTVFTGLLTGREKCRKNFNLRNETIDHFFKHDPSGKIQSQLCPNDRYGKYIGLLFEIYAGMPYLFRERIVISRTLAVISSVIENGEMIRLGPASPGFIPYTVRTDAMGRYLYVLGVYDNSKRTPVSFRVARLHIRGKEEGENTDIVKAPFRLSQEDKALIEHKIAENGAEYAGSNAEEIRVLMNASGLAHYREKTQNRPELELIGPYEKEETYSLYRCRSVRYKVLNYFDNAFGSGAVILAPEGLQSQIRKKFDTVVTAYEQNPPETSR